MNPDGPPSYPPYGYGYQQPGYPQPGYPQPGPSWGFPPEVKVGIVPLHPLDLGALYNGAFAAIRSNPGVMIGMTAVIVVLSQLLTFLVQVPLTRISLGSYADGDAGEVLLSIGASTAVSLLVSGITVLAALVLTGMLTVVVARAVLGDRTGSADAWRTVAPRILPLIGLALLQALIVLIPIALAVALVVGAAFASGEDGFFVVLILCLVLILVLLLVSMALTPWFSLASPMVVLEKLGPIAALQRSFRLQKEGYWRLLGILLFTSLITGVVASLIAVPFGFGSGLVTGVDGMDNLAGTTVLGAALAVVGAAIGQIIVMPFSAATTTLVYVDQRMRRECLDQVLRAEVIRRQTGAVSS